TYALAKEKADLVIRNERNLGKGMSLSRGISHLFANEEFDYIIMMDADGQHSPSDLGKFLEAARHGKDFVVGNRMQKHLGMPLVRVITNKFMSWLISLIARQKIPDSQCGFRLIKREVLEKIIIKTQKFEIESEVLVKAARLGFKIESIPIRSIYSKSLRSKIQPLIDSIRFIKFLFRLKNGRD
ncbi:MAG: glycosyltransferase family 2 protein, partial [Candidatus Omnitrophica bacterium]|nr:glycosyltransferase family 2 protein [Candidatus Omnitrophota bacterium]